MTPLEAWQDFVEGTNSPDNPKARALFLAGFTAGMRYLAECSQRDREEAWEEIKRTVADLEEAARRAGV
jgi:hypothetical protein